MEKEVLEVLKHIKNRPSMYMGGVVSGNLSYMEREKYLLGYLAGLGQLRNRHIEKEISIWYNKKFGKSASSPWTTLIIMQNKNKSDDELWAILIESVEEFINEHSQLFN